MSSFRVVGLLSLIAFLIISQFGCSGPFSSPSSTFDHYVKMAKAGDKDKWLDCYSDETRKLMTELEKTGGELMKKMGQSPELSSEQMNEMAKGEQPTVVSEKITGDKGILVLKDADETHELSFIKEKGNWKIDLSEELNEALKMFQQLENLQKGMKNYFSSEENNVPPANEDAPPADEEVIEE